MKLTKAEFKEGEIFIFTQVRCDEFWRKPDDHSGKILFNNTECIIKEIASSTDDAMDDIYFQPISHSDNIEIVFLLEELPPLELELKLIHKNSGRITVIDSVNVLFSFEGMPKLDNSLIAFAVFILFGDGLEGKINETA